MDAFLDTQQFIRGLAGGWWRRPALLCVEKERPAFWCEAGGRWLLGVFVPALAYWPGPHKGLFCMGHRAVMGIPGSGS